MAKTVQVTISKVELARIEDRTAIVTSPASKINVISVNQENKALDLLGLIKEQLSAIEKKRTSITKPINESLRTTNAMFKELAAPLKKADEIIRNKILAFRTEQEEKADAEQSRREKIQESHRLRGHETTELAQVEAETGSSVTAKTWTYDLVDIKKVPKEYLQLDLGSIRKAINGGRRNIPGLKIYQKSSLLVR